MKQKMISFSSGPNDTGWIRGKQSICIQWGKNPCWCRPGEEQELAWKVYSLVKIQKWLDLKKELERNPQTVLHLTNLRTPQDKK